VINLGSISVGNATLVVANVLTCNKHSLIVYPSLSCETWVSLSGFVQLYCHGWAVVFVMQQLPCKGGATNQQCLASHGRVTQIEPLDFLSTVDVTKCRTDMHTSTKARHAGWHDFCGP
jgi:hypothetical protein